MARMTSREFAKLIGVSQSTVSRAMNNSNLVPPEKRKYIQDKAREYGFALNSQAISLKTKKNNTIGILFPKHFINMSTNIMMAHIYDCLQKELSKWDYDVMVIHYNSREDDDSAFEKIIKKNKVDGFLVLRMELTDSEVRLINEYQVPCVFMMNAGAHIRQELNYLFSDSEYGGYLAGKYLGQFKDYEPAFITIREEKHDSDRRLSGFIRGLEEWGKALNKENILYCNLDVNSAYGCVLEHRALFLGAPVAMLAYSDILAIGVMNGAAKLGLSIPGDIQLIGMDDIPMLGWIRPALSTVHVNLEEMIPKSCQLLIDLIEKRAVKDIHQWLKPRLALRDTTLTAEKRIKI